ncbi:uncharacterized protein LOC123556308 [Mercenaria mercenaria]|uniref:uncharacterized protein LOC123556308 n=1 Tax=Mercenaria mercenaria TaxID=6596 RepID=UPI00234EA633|nr:uncharacterized protein LOC123556308 [Mercenaria mercenaria]
MRIEIVKGAVAEMKADVIVNSCNQALMLTHGGLTKSFARAAGPGLQTECSKTYPNGICFGDIAVTGGHRLNCKAVYHVALPPWDSEFVDAMEILCLTVCACLNRAHGDGMTSIAFPALGCGFLGYPYDRVARAMHDCFASFEKETTSTKLERTFVVIWPKGAEWKHIKQAFEQELSTDRKTVLPESNQDLKQSLVQRKGAIQDFLSTCVRETNRNSCKKVLGCGHICVGYRNEPACPPCIQPECASSDQHQTSQDDCIICYTDHLAAAPVVMLKCGHLFHLHCVKRILQNRWVGSKINFNFTKCPICKESIEHRELQALLLPLKALQDDVKHKAILRLRYDGLERCKEITDRGSKYFQKPGDFAMDRYKYFLCFKCKKAYFGGTTRTECGAEDDQFQPENLICPDCRGYRRLRQLPDAAVAKAVHSKENVQAQKVIQETTKACPHCGAHTEKNGGCMHMTCIKCKMDWCWLCEKHWELKCQRTHWFG